jgi:hypothetical protein
MSRLVKPHGGGELKPLLLEGAAREAELARAQSLTKIKMTSREDRRPDHDGHRRLHSAGRLHDPRRLGGRL